MYKTCNPHLSVRYISRIFIRISCLPPDFWWSEGGAVGVVDAALTDPPHLSASLPDWGWPSASAASAQVRVMVHSSLFIALLVTVRWWPVCLESSYCPRVRHQSRGRSSHTTQVNLGCLRSGQAQAWRGKLTGSKRNCQHLRILLYYCMNDITIQLESLVMYYLCTYF